MSEQEEEGTWTGLKKTILGTVATIVTAGGAWIGSQLFGGDEQPVQAPVQPSIVINNTQQQAAPATKTVVIKEQAAAPKTAKPKKPTAKEELEAAPAW